MVSVEHQERISYQLADFGTRFAAFFIDGLVLFMIESVGFMTARGVGVGIGFILGLAYAWFFWTRYNGQTPGKMVMKIRVVKMDGTPINDADVILRFVGYYVNSVLFVGWLWALFDAHRQGLHDKLAKTYVVRASE